ncbi:BTAD domain-containing putative transcriptional regulator [Streptomyces glomeratus]|uniref:OmpR/PhoB-type domain-containing protein n=1 Tax=Streptomyces glomeratus TaxID=284452 RepID=A0ABP6LH43_9ACTN|nr:BTAD domain-containing putative transcriptional regulator [Streptomyces glomeratus]MCF1506502.1 tetratricopeptide repeat protein [Streptomyces glomeratus]
MRHGLRFGLLGPPVMYDTDGESRPIGSGKMRALLVALLLEPGRVVSVDALKDALWGGAPPASAQASLQNHVTRLRRLLGEDGPERLRAVPPGYLLRVDEGELDVRVFEGHVAAARAAHTVRDWERTVDEASSALALWRGAPLGGPSPETGGHALVQRLEEARLLVLEWRYDAELYLGGARLGGLVPELAALVAEHPLREGFHRLLMLVLHRTGRPAEALAVHRDLRERLIEELGVEPGGAVREAHLEILRDDPGAPERRQRSVGPAQAGGTRAEGNGADGIRARPIGTEGAVADGGRIGGVHMGGGYTGGGHTGGGHIGGGRAGDGKTGGRDAVGRNVDGWDIDGRDIDGTDIDGTNAGGRNADDGRADGRNADDSQAGGRNANDRDSNRRHADGRHADGKTADEPHDGPHAAAEPGARGVPGAPGAGAPAAPDLPWTVHAVPRPAQLPPAPAHFTGRDAVRDALLRFLGAERDTPRVAVLSGMAGVGKSALALYVAHGLRKRFTDGQLYINLHGATPGMTPLTAEQALSALLRDLGAEPRRIPAHPDAAAALLRSLLAPTRTLMVLDDAANAAQVRPLLPGGPGCAVIVTSRSPLTALDGAHRVPLAPLSDEESAALLRAVSGRDGLDATHPLVELAGRLPLALRVVAARLAARRALAPDVLAVQLAATEGRLHHLEYDDLSVRRSLAVAHDALRASDREADRDAARALGRIGALDLPGYGAALLARLLGTDERRAEAALDRLVDVALLEETAYGRYAPHDLVRDFARETAVSEEAVSDETAVSEKAMVGDEAAVSGEAAVDEEATARGTRGRGAANPAKPCPADVALRWYTAMATRAYEATVESGTEREDRLRATPSQPESYAEDVAAAPVFGSPRAAADWLVLELDNVVALVERHADTSSHVPLLVRLIAPHLQRRGHVAELEVLACAALHGARRLGDAPAEAFALLDLAGLNCLKGRGNDALAQLDEALEIWRRLGHLSCLLRGLNNRAVLLERLGRYEETGETLRQCLEYTRSLNDPLQEALTYSNLGNLYAHTDPRAAVVHHRRSLEIGERMGHVVVRHTAHCNIGFAHLTLGEPDAAVPHFEESLRILGGHGHWQGESQTRLGLVRALRERGDSERAARECDVLRNLARRRGDCYVEGLARHQRGLLHLADGEEAEARRQWTAALAALDATDSPVAGELRERLAEG